MQTVGDICHFRRIETVFKADCRLN